MSRIAVIASNARSLAINRGRLIEDWVAMGHEVTALVPAYDAEPVWLNDLPCAYELISLRRLSFNPFRDAYALSQIVSRLAHLKPDITFSYAVKPVLYGSVAGRLVGVPSQFALITGLGYVYSGQTVKQRMLGKMVTLLYTLAFLFNEKVFFQNPDDAELFRAKEVLRKPEQAVVVNGSGVDLDEFHFVEPTAGPVTFLLMARLIRDKGIDLFVEAAARLNGRYPDARFIVLGAHDPNLPNSIPEEDLLRWKLETPVVFAGYHTDVRPFLARASVYVLPTSYREGTPRSILEALATGRAIITTDSPGCRETVVEGVNGFLIPPLDRVGLERAMERFLVDPALSARFGVESRNLAMRKFDVRDVNRTMHRAMGLN